MTDERRVITQDEDARFAVDHGGVALTGTTAAPLVHVVSWHEEPFDLEHSGRVVFAGDPEAPFDLHMHHDFKEPLAQTHAIEPVDHTLHVDSQLDRPIHHALQMRTPLQVRFCNPWHVASDYQVDIDLGRNRIMSVRLTGATVATPLPCDDERPCPPTSSTPPQAGNEVVR